MDQTNPSSVTISVDEAVRGLRVVVSGLIAGLVVMTAVVSTVGPFSRSADPQLVGGMLAGLAAFGVLSAVAYTAVRRKIGEELRARASELRRHADPAVPILDIYRRLVILRGGLTEGPAFFAAIVYLLSGHVLALAAIGLSIFLLAVSFPSAEKVRALADEALRG